MDETKPDYPALYREMAAQGHNFKGLSIINHRKIIRKLIRRVGAVTLLDYGSGRGDAYKPPHNTHVFWHVDRPRLYDPSFPEHDVMPAADETFDMVLCSDVLEHVPEDEVSLFIERLFSYANKYVWASVCCRPAKKKFPDGGNLHITVQPYDWWLTVFRQAAQRHPGIGFTLTESP